MGEGMVAHVLVQLLYKIAYIRILEYNGHETLQEMKTNRLTRKRLHILWLSSKKHTLKQMFLFSVTTFKFKIVSKNDRNLALSGNEHLDSAGRFCQVVWGLG